MDSSHLFPGFILEVFPVFIWNFRGVFVTRNILQELISRLHELACGTTGFAICPFAHSPSFQEPMDDGKWGLTVHLSNPNGHAVGDISLCRWVMNSKKLFGLENMFLSYQYLSGAGSWGSEWDRSGDCIKKRWEPSYTLRSLEECQYVMTKWERKSLRREDLAKTGESIIMDVWHVTYAKTGSHIRIHIDNCALV